jgi:farnesyl diphosphate synthase
MPFETELKKAATQVERILESIVAETADETPAHLLHTMRHGLLGGKRLRPFLVLASARMFGVHGTGVLRVGAALECVHCYSLLHDDLPAMDDDNMRRGRPTAHVAFGEAAAILAGDALLTLAFEILADPSTHQNPGIRADLVFNLARAAGARGMAGGQILDLDAATESLDEPAVMRMQAMKTGALIAFAATAGAILGAAAASDRARLSRYGQALGAAFQIGDDLLDREATPHEMGKATGKDAAAGKATLITLIGADAARARRDALIMEAKAELAQFGEAASQLNAAADFIMTRRK